MENLAGILVHIAISVMMTVLIRAHHMAQTAVDDWHGCADFAYNIRAVTEHGNLIAHGVGC